MTTSYPIVFEVEDDGAVSAYVPDLPVYAAADSPTQAERAIRRLLAAYLDEQALRGKQLPEPRTTVKVARVTIGRREPVVRIVSAAALLGHVRSAAKAAASRRNGARGGRPAGAGRRRTR